MGKCHCSRSPLEIVEVHNRSYTHHLGIVVGFGFRPERGRRGTLLIGVLPAKGPIYTLSIYQLTLYGPSQETENTAR